MHPTNNLARTIIHTEPNIVDTRLAALGLTQEDLNEILQRAMSFRLSTTKNNAVTAGGTLFYHGAIRAIRDVLSKKGFKRLPLSNVELTANDRIAIYICSGNDQTGLANAYPESRTKKGEFTRKILGLSYASNPTAYSFEFQNKQIDLDFSSHDNDEALSTQLGLDVWCLLHYVYQIDEYQWGMRAEFSQPTTYNQKNVVNGFSTRLILNTAPTDPVIKQDNEPQFTQDIEIDILKTG
ncbi:hypothetical protein [Xenorhabdus bovienii]|uniref:Putative plasmid-related protein n=1 Tax=Xenorhabdus bovienii str. Intermedium TaxID=1379677 RepID=A0A077QC44_XENBV|nr:hypothetical protein [Xenorhabdus bovienii]MDE9484059.1 hypothetical protein [Xenorhabdus bovienii]MDE9552616.1 hypothetical protein [Xenorhabdus bovienii]CDH33762.1 putative plasmid-related protein [Xenorhabdus bovienii str. Intermedium]